MNIIEIARKAGLRSAVLLDMYKTKDALTPSEELELEQYQTFANDVIVERDKELIEGAGEPACNVSPYEVNTIYWNAGHADAGCNSPLYTAAQVAGAVAKARINALDEAIAECRKAGNSSNVGYCGEGANDIAERIFDLKGGATC